MKAHIDESRSFRWLIDQYRGSGFFPYIFGIALVVAVVLAVGSLWLAFTRPEPIVPWGEFTTPAYVGTVGDEPDVVVREISGDGLPVVRERDITVTMVRCGPPDLTSVVEERFWFIAEGSGSRIVERVEGLRVPFTYEPIPAEECQIVTTRLEIPKLVIAAGTVPISFRVDVAASEGNFSSVVLKSEQFYYDPNPDAGTLGIGRVTLAP